MKQVAIGTVEITGEEFEILVDPASGRFTLIRDGERAGFGETLAAAKQAARQQLAKKKIVVSVPFLMPDGSTGEAYGIHAGTSKVLARVPNRHGKTEAVQLESYRSNAFRVDTPRETIERYAEITDQTAALGREKATIEREYGLNLGQAVRQAMDVASREAVGVSDG